MGGPWAWVPTDAEFGFDSGWTEQDVEDCAAVDVSPYHRWINTDPANTIAYYYTSQQKAKFLLTLHPVIVGPILYCFFVFWAYYRTKSIDYGYNSSSYDHDFQDWLQNTDHSTAPPTGGSVCWENTVDEPADGDLGPVTVLVKAAVYTPELLEQVKAAVDDADLQAIGDIVNNMAYIGSPYWGYEAVDWFPDAPDELVMQTKLTNWFINHLNGNEMWLADSLDNMVMKTRPHTKEELVAADLWPPEDNVNV
jgi:hypothetical protein